MSEEKKQILKMVEEGKISAVEALKLFEALDQQDTPKLIEVAQTNIKSKRVLKICVSDLSTGKKKVDVKVPLGFLKFGLKWVPKKYLNDLNQGDIMSAIEKDNIGTIIDVIDEEKNEKVEISIE